MTTRTEFEGFPAHAIDDARAALAKAHARATRAAARCGQDAPPSPTLVVEREYVRCKCRSCGAEFEGGERCDRDGCGGSVRRAAFADLVLDAAPLRLAGWDFLAVVEPLTGGNLIRVVPGAVVAEGELASWRDVKIACDHCAKSRRRSETFVVRADGSDPAIPTGTYRQVGRSCLESFLGRGCSAVVAAIGWPDVVRLAGDPDADGGWGRAPEALNPTEFLAWVVAVARVAGGFVTRAAARASFDAGGGLLSTSDVAWSLGAGANRPPADQRPSDEDIATAAAALAWARALTGSSDYETNLVLVARQELVTRDRAGILASVITAHGRALGEAATRAARAAAPSTHVGIVGERLELAVAVERVVSLDPGQYGPASIVVMRDDVGRLLSWKTGAVRGPLRPGARVKIRGTVKRHGEFRGEAQTDLVRCSVVSTASD